MFKILAIIAIGVVIGVIIRSERSSRYIAKVMSAIIYLMLLVLGICVGANQVIMDNLSTIGLKALIITIGGVVGSCICAMLLDKYIFSRKR